MTNQDEVSSAILNEVKVARKELKTDHYNMRIGELINIYDDGELYLYSAYKRLSIWDNEQQTRFIESLIIGLPIPPIYVAQKLDGTWDVVDGSKRLSTIFELTGRFNYNIPLVLGTCEYIPSIVDQNWDTLPAEVKRSIKRAKLTVNIILTENIIDSQYGVFKRLNNK